METHQNTQIKYYCSRPFEALEFHTEGDVYVCCPNWLTKKIGNLNDQTIDEIWNSTDAQEIRESIIDGSYKYCNKELCPYIKSYTLPSMNKLSAKTKEAVVNRQTILNYEAKDIMFNFDRSCNLTCPSCRTEMIFAKEGSVKYIKAQQYAQIIQDKFFKEASDHEIVLNITGSGDPFASIIFRDFLINLDGKKFNNLKIDLQTNGVLFTEEMWNAIHKIHGNLNRIFVSIDAATEKTYLITRRGGDFKRLLLNMKFLAQKRREKKFNLLQANFVVQKNNFREMTNFAKLFIEIGCDTISFSKLTDWETWEQKTYEDQLVFDPKNSNYYDFLNELSNEYLTHSRINISNLYVDRKAAILWKANNLSKGKRFHSSVKRKFISTYSYVSMRKFFLPRPVTNFLIRWKLKLINF